jgi:hypothetical protein
MDYEFLTLAVVGAIISSIIMGVFAIADKTLLREARPVYLLVAALDIYLGIIYTLALIGKLSVPGYGSYVRPVLVPVLGSAPAIAVIHWLQTPNGIKTYQIVRKFLRLRGSGMGKT